MPSDTVTISAESVLCLAAAAVAGRRMDDVRAVRRALLRQARPSDQPMMALLQGLERLICDNGSTPQTILARKRNTDPVVIMEARGAISTAQARALNFVREMQWRLTRALQPAAASLMRIDAPSSWQDPAGRLTDLWADLHARVYMPWAKAWEMPVVVQSEKGSMRVLSLSHRDVVFRVADCWSVRHLAPAVRWEHSGHGACPFRRPEGGPG
ncbi:MAG: hypothetical protein FD153_31 [Rhodospirillaceae bacterium]|nr:MAG: hypothetical protein FD153_31 [Rhodospirillaceae bacterium]